MLVAALFISKKVEPTFPSTDKLTVIYPCNRIYSNEKEWSINICCNLDDSQHDYAERKKSKSTFYKIPYMKF